MYSVDPVVAFKYRVRSPALFGLLGIARKSVPEIAVAPEALSKSDEKLKQVVPSEQYCNVAN